MILMYVISCITNPYPLGASTLKGEEHTIGTELEPEAHRA